MLPSRRLAPARVVASVLLAGVSACTYERVPEPPALPAEAGADGSPPFDAAADRGEPANAPTAADGGTADARVDVVVIDAAPADRAPDAAPDLPEDAAPPPCTERTRTIRAIDGVSLDYGPPRPDKPEIDPLRISVGNGHGHNHDMGAWMKFPLDVVPRNARLEAARVEFTAMSEPPTPIPDVVLLYSEADGWSKRSTDAGQVPRTIAIADGSGSLVPGRQSAPIDLRLYAPLFANDLLDGMLTLGLAPAEDPAGTFRTATVQSAVPGNADDPVLVLTTCE